jgi:uncharacterized protein YgiM (DUF1202 family)
LTYTKLLNWKTVVSSLALFLIFKICPAQDLFPFEGGVNANNINIRSDSTISSPVICTLNKGEKIDIISQSYEWYKIMLPKRAPAYIKRELVMCVRYKHIDSTNTQVVPQAERECEAASVLKSRVNVRLYPNESSAVLGKVNKDEIINIVKDNGDWLKIEPPQNSFGWINKKLVDRVVIFENQKKNDLTKNLKSNITLFGIVKPHGKVFKRKGTHKLITEDNQIFLLKGNKIGLDALNYHKVKATGIIIGHREERYPLVEINTLEIIN